MNNLIHTKHKNIMMQILKDIYQDVSIAPYLGFKGGTAALFFYDLPRHSVDLDFDLLDEIKEEMVFKKVEEIVSKYGNIVDSHKKRFNLLHVLSYESHAPKIKIEINTRKYGSTYELKSLLGISVKVMIKEDMFAHKLMAMYERIGKTSRDIFDVEYFASRGWGINKKIVESRSGMGWIETVDAMIDKLEKLDNKHILDGLGELMSDGQKDRVKAKLKSDTIFQLKMMREMK